MTVTDRRGVDVTLPFSVVEQILDGHGLIAVPKGADFRPRRSKDGASC